MHQVLDAPDAGGGIRGPWGELLGERADVGPGAGAGGGCEGGGGGAEGGQVEGGEEGGGEDDEAVAVEGGAGGGVGICWGGGSCRCRIGVGDIKGIGSVGWWCNGGIDCGGHCDGSGVMCHSIWKGST